MKRLSCKDIQGSIYLAPNEVRTCCQRFFVDGQMKGDVQLLEAEEHLSMQDIIIAKQKLVEGINNGTDDRCTGCRYLHADEWPDIAEEEVACISFEYHSICNMRCSYCSDVYYGGLRAPYDVMNLLSQINKTSDDLHFAWAGGEPTIEKGFEALFHFANENFKPRTQRVFTNASKHSPALQKALDARIASITTSVDAGTEATFYRVRNARRMDRVFSNLQKYSEVSNDLITIKYILTEFNYHVGELDEFIKQVNRYRLNDCNFLISMNFKDEFPNEEIVCSIMYLYWKLYQSGCVAVTIDDHIFKRTSNILDQYRICYPDSSCSLRHEAIQHELHTFIDSLKEENRFVLWGTGSFARLLIEKSRLLDRDSILYFVDTNESRWGQRFFEKEIKSPVELLSDNTKIIIASVSFFGEIIHKMLGMGVRKDRILPTFVV